MIYRDIFMGGWRLGVVRWLVAVLLLAAGCTPSYNWRELDVADGHVRAAFPAKVETQTREIKLHGRTLPFTLTIARVDHSVFAVGSAPLPEALSHERDELARALIRALYMNIGAPVPPSLPGFGEEFVARGAVNQQQTLLLARVWATETMIIQAVATGTDTSLPMERAEEFVRAIELKTPRQDG